MKTKAALLEALKKAKAGQVIFVPDGVEIDMTGKQLRISAGVTLAGTRGLNGSSGARMFTTDRGQNVCLIGTGGYDVRITGLRFEGPEKGREKPSRARFLVLGHSGGEVDNCEIWGFNHRCLMVLGDAIDVYIHHNYIHHCQQGGFGYGVIVDSGYCRIIANRFEWCRHEIASIGSPGCAYEAAWNFVGPHSYGYNFDMHAGRDRGDGTDIAGDWIHIQHNTFQTRQAPVGIRGTPAQWGKVHHNWFAGPDEGRRSVRGSFGGGNRTRVYRNAFGFSKEARIVSDMTRQDLSGPPGPPTRESDLDKWYFGPEKGWKKRYE